MASGDAASLEASALGSSLPKGRLNGFVQRFADFPVPFTIRLASGEVVQLGQGTPMFQLTVHDKAGMRALASLNERRIADAYIDGHLDVRGDMLQVFHIRERLSDRHKLFSLWRFIEPLLLGQVKVNRRAIASHYEQDAAFFLNFLDDEVPLYTQGIFASDDETLRESALRKLEYCFEACQIKPGDHVLEIGPGWGSWLKYASARGVNCSAISISQYSIDYLQGEADRLGYRWELVYSDLLEYRPGRKYDAIVMMGIIEHLPHYDRVLKKFDELLKPGGRIFLDGSTAAKKYALSSTTVKHIFPGNHSPWVIHDFLAHVAESRFHVREMFDDRHSYFLTLKNWAINWDRNEAATIARFGEQAYRRFRLYFWGTALQFYRHHFGCYRMILGSRGD